MTAKSIVSSSWLWWCPAPYIFNANFKFWLHFASCSFKHREEKRGLIHRPLAAAMSYKHTIVFWYLRLLLTGKEAFVVPLRLYTRVRGLNYSVNRVHRERKPSWWKPNTSNPAVALWQRRSVLSQIKFIYILSITPFHRCPRHSR